MRAKERLKTGDCEGKSEPAQASREVAESLTVFREPAMPEDLRVEVMASFKVLEMKRKQQLLLGEPGQL